MNTIDDHLARLEALWLHAHNLESEALKAASSERPLSLRVKEGLAVDCLELTDVHGAAGGRYRLHFRREGPGVDFHPGPSSPVVLLRTRAGREERHDGLLKTQTDNEWVVVCNALPDSPEEGRYVMEPAASRTTWERGRDALKRLRRKDADRSLHTLLLGHFPGSDTRKPLGSPDRPSTADASWNQLNVLQQQAVQAALHAPNTFVLHGPPGTGKSHVLAALVRQLLAQGQRVLLTAPSNAAVDHLALRLLAQGIDVLRLGHPGRIDPLLAGATLDERLTQSRDWALAQSWIREARRLESQRSSLPPHGRWSPQERALQREIARLWKDARTTLRHAEDACMASAPVLATTCTGAGSRRLDGQHFDVVLIDEATQAFDPLLLCALERAPKRVLAGDPHQLSPMVPQDLKGTPLERPLLETLLREADQGHSVRLAVQYRMHATIMEHPSVQHYDGALVADETVADAALEALPGVAPDPNRPGPLLFLDTAGRGWEEERQAEGESWRNPGMAERTTGEVRRLLSRGVPAAHVGVITPYAAQRALLRQLLSQEVQAGLEVDTVDAFQGREKEAIVWDTVRSGQESVGFLRDVRRLNVAWTRARRFLMILGDSATLAQLPWWSDALEFVERNGHWRSVWEDEP